MFLNIAKKGVKLPNLDKNIKCGNSLVENEKFAGDKAFNWKKEYPNVFDEGGFDIIVGNPPYIKENVNKNAFNGLRDSPYYQGKMDIWTFFGCIALDLIKENGLIGFIAPNNWITNAGASKFRNKVNEEAEIKIFKDFGNYKVFESANIQTMIYIMSKNNKKNEYQIKYSLLKKEKIEDKHLLLNFLNSNITDDGMISFKSIYNRKENENSYLNFIDEKETKILNKIKSNDDIYYLNKNEISTGIDVHQDFLNKKGANLIDLPIGSGIFVINHNEKINLNLSKSELELIKPYYTTNEIHKYYIEENHKYWVIYTKSNINEHINNYPNLKQHFDLYSKVITSDNKPYGLHRARNENIFKNEKIIVTRKCTTPTFSYANYDTYVSQTFNVIKTDRFNLKIILGILNSKLIKFWLKNKGKMQGNNYQLDKEPLLNIPLKYRENELTNSIKQNVINLLNDTKSLFEESNGFNKWLKRTFSQNIEIINYYDLTFNEFLDELKKNNLKIKDRKTQELLEKEFNNSLEVIIPLKAEIERLEEEINQKVYKLYELTPEEIKIVEDALNC